MEGVEFSVNSPIDNAELNDLYAASWPSHTDADHSEILNLSLAYICARHGGELVGFVYLTWDGGAHAFLLDTTVHPRLRRQGVGLELVRRAVAAAREKGCQWVHVDYEDDLEAFYSAAGFRPTKAGLIKL